MKVKNDISIMPEATVAVKIDEEGMNSWQFVRGQQAVEEINVAKKN